MTCPHCRRALSILATYRVAGRVVSVTWWCAKCSYVEEVKQ